MLTLLIDTSTERGVVFIFKNNTLVFERYLPPGLHNSTDLMPAIASGLQSISHTVKDLQLIGVGIGPGSYTGLRVGAMAAKTLSYAQGIPLIGFCSLAGFTSKENGDYVVVIDAKIGGVYVLTANQQPFMCSLQEVSEHLKADTLLVTPNSQVLSKKLNLLFPENQWRWEEAAPNPHTIHSLVLKLNESGKFTTDGSVDLLYMRKTQAEIEKENKQLST